MLNALRLCLNVGLTKDLERRIGEHNLGSNKSTKPYAPFEIIYSEKLPNRIQARKKREISEIRNW